MVKSIPFLSVTCSYQRAQGVVKRQHITLWVWCFQNSVRIPCHNASFNRKELRRLCDQMMQETDPTCWLPGHSEGILDCSTWDHLRFWRKNERQHQDLSLSPHVDKLAMTLSGGNKRDRALDLSLAIPQHKRQRINVQSSRIWTYLNPWLIQIPSAPFSLCFQCSLMTFS